MGPAIRNGEWHKVMRLTFNAQAEGEAVIGVKDENHPSRTQVDGGSQRLPDKPSGSEKKKYLGHKRRIRCAGRRMQVRGGGDF